jgi:hypothetical protein
MINDITTLAWLTKNYNIPNEIISFWEKIYKDKNIGAWTSGYFTQIYLVKTRGDFSPPRREYVLAVSDGKDKEFKYKVGNSYFEEKDYLRVAKLLAFT